MARAMMVVAPMLLVGCASVPPTPTPFSEIGANGVELSVENQNFYDATIYVVSEVGTERRVGDVVGNTSRSFQVPWDFTQDMSIRFEMLAGGWCRTHPVVVSPGDELGLEIVPNFEASAFCAATGGGLRPR